MSRDVDVEENGGEWEIDSKKAKDSVIDFPKGEKDIEVKFKLKGDTAKRFRFDTDDPIWVHENNQKQCPPKDSTNKQITVEDCTDKVLTLKNTNEDPSTLRYQLNLIDSGGHRVVCDPEIRNGGR